MRSFSTFSPALRSLIRFHIAYVRTPVAAHMMGTAASAPVGRSACAAISMTRAALLDELDEFADAGGCEGDALASEGGAGGDAREHVD